MIYFNNINPIFIFTNYLSVSWYGIIYIIGFTISIWYGKRYIQKKKYIYLNKINFEILIYNSFFGLLIGGRIGYIIFYNHKYIFNNILYIFKIWEGGMSFHGGLIGVIITILLFKKKFFFEISDFLSIIAPINLGIGRLGNFINGELWGKVTEYAPCAILFPKSKLEDLIYILKHPKYQFIFIKYGNLTRHPSQIYECLLEGVILFIILKIINKKYILKGITSSIFLIIYSIFRFLSEFFREPDVKIGLFYNILSMGQILSIIMLIIGILMIIILKYKNYK